MQEKSQGSPVSPTQSSSQRTAEQLVIHNGNLIENLLSSEEWRTIVEPLLEETIASVCGRKTKGRYYHGTFTKDWSNNTGVFLSGYQKGLMDFHNHLHDFIVARDQMLERQKTESAEQSSQTVNPFMED